MLWDSIRYNLGNLLNFSGRESRARFWPYAAIVFVLSFVALNLIMTSALSGSMANVQRYAAEHPEQVTQTVGPGSYSVSIKDPPPGLMPDMGPAILKMDIVALVMALLLAAAVTRRLHDRGRRGWWGLLPLIFLGYSSYMMPSMFADFGKDNFDITIFMAVFVSNLLYLATLVLLIVLLCLPGTAGPNRFGEQPE